MILRRKFDYFCFFVLTMLVLSDCGSTLFKRRSPFHTSIVRKVFTDGWRKTHASADVSAGLVFKNWRKKSQSSANKFSAGRMFNSWRRKAGARVDGLPPDPLFKGWRRKADVQKKKLFNRMPYNVETTYTPVNYTSFIYIKSAVKF